MFLFQILKLFAPQRSQAPNQRFTDVGGYQGSLVSQGWAAEIWDAQFSVNFPYIFFLPLLHC